MPKGGRFGRMARDLEKLPCELIEPVLADLGLEQVIRMSKYGGPRVIWSIEYSPTWKEYFRDGRAQVLRRLLAVTDQVETFCFRQNNCNRHYAGSPGEELSFLSSLSRSWTHSNYPAISQDNLQAIWLHKLSVLLARTTETIYKDSDCFKLLKPYLSAADLHALIEIGYKIIVFSKDIEITFLTYNHYRHSVKHDLSRALPADELSTFVALHQRARRARGLAMAAELRRLAALSEAHPTRVKEPWAPQTRRVNEEHVPRQLRAEARKLERSLPAGNKKRACSYRFVWAFPALVPYDWCLRLFTQVLEKSGMPGGVYAPEIEEKVVKVLDGLACVYGRDGTRLDGEKTSSVRLRTAGTPWSVQPEGKNDGKAKFETERIGRDYDPHADVELEWLETFVEVVAWMEKEFPEDVKEVRGSDWYEGNEVARIRREKRRAGTTQNTGKSNELAIR
ncbi:hypothetical protein GTA08_BOTSDO04277 [Botryosphaeria dothidea]|uniref:Uncharacterized protein n=1 Tax=Botryosphaeria dothidea TaxID=55169 RepID=A0A8H4IXT4_9PEZI|nr:hypothetical protein GTA08_BOTSDO04277 [Botryosphaeria dothidea]